jgi:hypothetical protein
VKRCGSWHSPIPELLLATREEDVTGYPAYDRESLQEAELRQGGDKLVTLLGDAAHPMSPFKGQVNILLSSLTLSLSLFKSGSCRCCLLVSSFLFVFMLRIKNTCFLHILIKNTIQYTKKGCEPSIDGCLTACTRPE